MRSLKVFAATTAAAAVALGGTLLMAPSASAQAPDTCRSDNLGGAFAPISGGIAIDSCIHPNGNGSISSDFGFVNTTGQNVEYCAHVLDTANLGGPWAWDFGCSTPTSAQNGIAYPGSYYAPANGGMNWTPPINHSYVISAGAWVNGSYVGDVESPVYSTWIMNPGAATR